MDDIAGIYAREIEPLDATIQVGVAGGKLLKLTLPASADPDAQPQHDLLDRIAAYARGREDDFDDLEIALTMPTDQRAALEALRQVPYGESTDVQTVAGMAAGLDHDDEDDVATVRTAIATNPTPIVIADHRVDDAEGATPGHVRATLRELEGLSP